MATRSISAFSCCQSVENIHEDVKLDCKIEEFVPKIVDLPKYCAIVKIYRGQCYRSDDNKSGGPATETLRTNVYPTEEEAHFEARKIYMYSILEEEHQRIPSSSPENILGYTIKIECSPCAIFWKK
jgi:hypothetical protein